MSTDPNAPCVVAGRLNEIEAAMLIAQLAESGIKADVRGANAAVMGGDLGAALESVSVVVRQADVKQAKRLLDGLRRS